MVVSYLRYVELLLVDRPPSMPDVCQHKRYEDADNGHGGERELAGARILDGERRLQVGCLGIVGRVVPSGTKQ